MAKHKTGTLLADLQEALEMGAEPDQIESLLNQVDGLFTRIETRRQKIERQAGHINQIERSRTEMRKYISQQGWGKRSAKGKRARQKTRRLLRAIDEQSEDYLELRREVEEMIGYVQWLAATKRELREAKVVK